MIVGCKLGVIGNVLIRYVVGTKVALHVGSTVGKEVILVGGDIFGMEVILHMKLML